MPTQTQRIVWVVIVAGHQVSEVTDISISAGVDQTNSQATLYCTARPSWADEGQTVEVWAGTAGAADRRIFAGALTGIQWEYDATRVGLDCRDLLARTRLAWGGVARTYTSEDDAAVIRNLLEAMGIPSSVASIQSSSWTLGVIQPVVLKPGDVPYSLIQQIDDLAGYKTYSTCDGTILRRRVSGVPGATPALTFAKGTNILGRPRRIRTLDGIVNHCIVTGLTYEGLIIGGVGVGEAQAANIYIPNPPQFVTETIQSNLVEDNPTALAIAQRIVNDKNRRPESLELTVLFEPRVQPGMTINVQHGDLETGSALVFVEHVEHQLRVPSTTVIRTTGGNLSGFTTPPPIATFSVTTFLEGMDTGSGQAGVIVIVADGSQSYSPSGSITAYAWSATGTATASTPTTGSAPVFRCTVPSTDTDISITLTVTDSNGSTDALTLDTPLNTSTMTVEDLSTAEGFTVAFSSDGQQSWLTATPASGEARCCCAFAPGWGQVWGTTTGHVYATFDKLASGVLTDLGQPAGFAVSCTAVWVHEVDQTRLWAGFVNGDVWFAQLDTTAMTAAWTHQGTIPEGPINEIRESYGTQNELRATAGAGYYYSADGGASWSNLHTFAAVAWRMAAGFAMNWASGLNDPSPMFNENGSAPTFPSLSPPVQHVRGISFGWRRQEAYASDDQARLFLSSDLASFTLQTDAPAAIVNHMVRSGNEDRVVYMAIGDGTGSNNGTQKWIPGAAQPFYVRKTGGNKTWMVGYGAAHQPPPGQATLIAIPNAASGAADNLFIYKNGLWSSKALPESGKNWVTCNASPFDGKKLLLWRWGGNGDNALWYSSDQGTTWTNIFTNLSYRNDQPTPWVDWSWTVPTGWFSTQHGSGINNLMRGSGTGFTNQSLPQHGYAVDRPTIGPALNDEVIGFDANGAIFWISLNGTVTGGVVTTISPHVHSQYDEVKGTRQAVAIATDAAQPALITRDYKSEGFGAASVDPPDTSAYGTSICVTIDGSIYVGGKVGGVSYCPGAMSLGPGNPVPWPFGFNGTRFTYQTALAGHTVGYIRSDRQTQQIAAVVYDSGNMSTNKFAFRDPSTGNWTIVPRPTAAGPLANFCEVIVGT